MGLNTTHDCFDGFYSDFYAWRNELCRVAGITYRCEPRNRTPAELRGDWAETPDDILYVLIDHTDTKWHILAKHCEPLAVRLAELLPQFDSIQDRDTAGCFVRVLLVAAAKGEKVIFSPQQYSQKEKPAPGISKEDRAQWLNVWCILRAMDYPDLETAAEDGLSAGWDALDFGWSDFCSDPAGYLLQTDAAQAAIIWRAVEKRLK